MALSGSFSQYPVVKKSHSFGLYCEWSGNQNISGNYTDVTLKVYLRYWTLEVSARKDCTVSINGTSETYNTGYINDYAEKDTYRLIKTYTVRVPHNSDGTKSCTLSASWSVNGTYSDTYVGRITASATVTLDSIPRASTITVASNVILGNACNIAWTPAANSYTFKLKFSLGNWSYTTETISPNSTSAYTYTGYTFPLAVANQLPSATTGTMTVYLYTYSGATQIGSTASKTFTVTLPSTVIPTLSNVSAKIINTNSVISNWGVAVAGYTKIKVSASASGSYGSTISSFSIGGGYSTTQTGTSLDYTGDVISSSGDKTFTITAKDSRSRLSASSTTSAITFYAYSRPTVSLFTVSRSSSNAKQVVAKVNWTYASVGERNIVTAALYYKKPSDTSWTKYGPLSQNTNTTLTTEFEETSSYNFKVVVTDSLLNSAQEEGFVSTIEVTMDFRDGGKGLGIGKIAESDNLEIAFDTIFMGDVYMQDADGTKVNIFDKIYPVGSIYTSVNNVSPSILFGGEWQQITGRFLLSCDDTYAAGSTGGEAQHTLTANEMPTHNHNLPSVNNSTTGTIRGTIFSYTNTAGTGEAYQAMYLGNTGGGLPHNNMPPYLAVYMWKRTK